MNKKQRVDEAQFPTPPELYIILYLIHIYSILELNSFADLFVFNSFSILTFEASEQGFFIFISSSHTSSSLNVSH